MTNVRIIAIDPGTTESAVVIWKTDGGLQSHFKLPHQDVRGLLKNLAADKVVTKLAVEMIASFGMPVGKEVFETCLWIGRYIECFLTLNPFSTHHLIYRRDVKIYLCGSMKAKDGNIRQSIVDRFGGKEKAIGRKASPGPLYGIAGDEWQALAVALTAEYHERLAASETSAFEPRHRPAFLLTGRALSGDLGRDRFAANLGETDGGSIG